MTRDEFLLELAELLEIDEVLHIDTSLQDMEEFDSLAIMSLIALIDDNFDMTVSGEKLGECGTVTDLIALIGEDKFK